MSFGDAPDDEAGNADADASTENKVAPRKNEDLIFSPEIETGRQTIRMSGTIAGNQTLEVQLYRVLFKLYGIPH
ncbi:hypothetical protein FOPE_03248 [Fonsecaea pedrosoi]|nr:hypothetical protein FOPE_03248 [Fonsecaea pedrosoi]